MCSEVTALDTVTVVIQFQFIFRLAKNVAVLLYRLQNYRYWRRSACLPTRAATMQKLPWRYFPEDAAAKPMRTLNRAPTTRFEQRHFFTFFLLIDRFSVLRMTLKSTHDPALPF